MGLSCSRKAEEGSLYPWERTTILQSDSVMYVPTIMDRDDSILLRTPCIDFSLADLGSPLFKTLSEKMLSTVNAPEQDGVGIAATQVGLSHRVVAVLRYDKEGEPFEIYPNIEILEYQGNLVDGAEGCLSVPPYRGNVRRWEKVLVKYTSPRTLRDTTELVEGYTARIFQHEVDHINGTLYIDRADTVFVNEDWKKEREAFAAQGKYLKPEWMKNLRKD